MAMTVIGACISQGVWKKDGRDIVYNNLKICYVEELSIIKDDSGNVTAWGIGCCGKEVKIKNDTEHLKSVFGCDVDDKFLNSLIGKKINIYYDMYRNAARIDIVKA